MTVPDSNSPSKESVDELGHATLDPRFHLAAIVDSSNDPIISKQLDGTIISWNKAAERVFGYRAEEIIGKSILTLIPPELFHEEEEILKKIGAGIRIEHFETTRMRKNGERFPVSVTISPVKDSDGRIVGASKIAREISEQKRVERLLLESEKLAVTGKMAAAIAHEINNPLECLMNLIYIARNNSDKDSRIYQFLVSAENEVARVAHIAQQVLGYYKDTGSPVEVQVHELLQSVVEVYDSKMLANRISIEAHFNDLQRVLVCKGEMLQVFSNVIANAIDAMPTGGALYISTLQILDDGASGVKVVIRDSGVGIKPEDLPHVFEPFYTTKGQRGTGIGLWVTKRLVEKHGGHINIASAVTSQNSGTVVTIFVPFTHPAIPRAGTAQR